MPPGLQYTRDIVTSYKPNSTTRQEIKSFLNFIIHAEIKSDN